MRGRGRDVRCPPLYGRDLTSSPPHGGISSFGATTQEMILWNGNGNIGMEIRCGVHGMMKQHEGTSSSVH